MGERRDDPGASQPAITLGKHRGLYCAVIGQGRGRRRRTLGTADPGLARTRLAEFIRQYQAHLRPAVTVGAILDAYQADRAEEVADPERIKYAVKALKPQVGHLLPTHIDRKVCRDYVKARATEGAKVGTAHTELAALRAALNWGTKQQPPWLDRAPFIFMPTKPEPRDRHLTREEAARLVAAAGPSPHVQLFIVLALHTAARVTALLTLTWTRVDLERRRIYLRDPEQGPTRKGRATVPIGDELHAYLTEAREAAIGGSVIELAGHQIKSIKKGVASAAKRAGLKGVSPHVLRHTAAVWMAEQDVAMPVIAQYMGHSDDRITQRVYARFSPSYLQDAARAIEGNRRKSDNGTQGPVVPMNHRPVNEA
jgi:integrase